MLDKNPQKYGFICYERIKITHLIRIAIVDGVPLYVDEKSESFPSKKKRFLYSAGVTFRGFYLNL